MTRKSFKLIRSVVFGITLTSQLFFIGIMWNTLKVNFNMALTSNDCNTRNLLLRNETKNSSLKPNFSLRYEDKLIQKCKIRPSLSVNCKGLFMGDPTAVLSVKNTSYPKTVRGNCSLSNLVNNCQVLLQAHEYIINKNNLTNEELDYPLAFAIKMHKATDQAEQLLRTIYRPHNVYCIYVDKKAHHDVYDVITKLAKCFTNVHVIDERFDIIYASIFHVLAEFQCMHELLATGIRWKYYINLTGQEFPLKTNLEIIKILKALQGSNDVESFLFPKHLKFRVEKKFSVQNGGLKEVVNATKQPFISNITLRKGSAYGVFRREFVEFMLEDAVAQKLIHWLNDSLAPEETVWATLNGFPWAPGGYTLQTSHGEDTFLSRAIIWQWDKPPCKGQFVRSVCVFDVGSLPWLASRPHIITNKFDRMFDAVAPDCMEELIRNRTKSSNSFENLDWYYYRNLPHVKYYANLTSEQKSLKYLNRKKDLWTKQQKKI